MIFFVQYPGSRGHPLHAPFTDYTPASGTVVVGHPPL